MDTIREQLNKPAVAGIVGLIAGILIGWMLLGWWLFPVKWTDASPDKLRVDVQEDYLRMSIDSFNLNLDAQTARQRWDSLGAQNSALLDVIKNNPGLQSPAAIDAFGSVVESQGAPTTDTPASKSNSLARTVLPWACGITLILAAVLALMGMLRRRGVSMKLPVTPAQRAQQASREAERTDFESAGGEPPIAQFMTTYMKGDDLFDDSFSIDSPAGEFLGECGVGISDTIGVGDPKRVTAFEVWLFDKNDIQTVTKVLMSEHAYHDEATVDRLKAKGEPIWIKPGSTVTLETATLQLVVKAIDVEYGKDALPDNSFFGHITLELAAWPKGGGTEPTPELDFNLPGE